jgi:hypothetical protein
MRHTHLCDFCSREFKCWCTDESWCKEMSVSSLIFCANCQGEPDYPESAVRGPKTPEEIEEHFRLNS